MDNWITTFKKRFPTPVVVNGITGAYRKCKACDKEFFAVYSEIRRDRGYYNFTIPNVTPEAEIVSVAWVPFTEVLAIVS